MGDELDELLLSFKVKIGDKSYEKIAAILRQDDFTSRLSLKLLDSANLEEILKGSDLLLGARKMLDNHLDLIRKQSPLNRKALRSSWKYRMGYVTRSLFIAFLKTQSRIPLRYVQILI